MEEYRKENYLKILEIFNCYGFVFKEVGKK